jgi:hypothetical protein
MGGNDRLMDTPLSGLRERFADRVDISALWLCPRPVDTDEHLCEFSNAEYGPGSIASPRLDY